MKAHVGMETRLCIVCGKESETGSVLLDRHLKNSLERHTCTGYGLCPEHQKLYNDGYIALVEVDPTKSKLGPLEGELLPSNAHRTGGVIHLRLEAARQIITGVGLFQLNGKMHPMLFMDAEAVAKIKSMIPTKGE